MSSDKNTSTLQSVIDSTSSTIQSAVAAVTGNPADKSEANKKQAEADARNELSHTAGKLGPVTVTPEGGVAADSSDRSEGAWNRNVGAAKEAIGGFVGAEGLRQQGIQQNREGKGQEAAGQIDDLGAGIKDRVGGTVGGAVAGLTGDRVEQERYQKQHDDGKAKQRGVELDLQKEANA